MPDVPGTTLNSIPWWNDWLNQLYPRSLPTLPSTNTDPTMVGGSLPLMAPTMVGHPTGLRDREQAILAQYGNE